MTTLEQWGDKKVDLSNMLQMKTFNSLDWTIDETGLFADNRHTGERILMSRFIEPARNGIIFTSTEGTMNYTIHSQSIHQIV